MRLPNPLAKMAFGAMTYLNRNLPNPLAKIAFGAMTYLDRRKEEAPGKSRVLISATINDKCNLECEHCVERGYQRGKDKFDLLKKRVKEMKPVVWFSIAGKEPTMTPERMAEIAKLARTEAGKVIVMTNGVLFDSKMQERVARDVDYVDISVDGLKTYKTPENVWENIRTASRNFGKTSVLTTLMNGACGNFRKVGDLTDKIADDFQGDVDHSVGFYLGWPGDERLLSQEQVKEAIRQLADKKFKTTIQIPLAYSHMLPQIIKEFGINEKSLRYDSATGIPSFELNGHKLVVPSLLETPLIGLRAENDGKVYFGCSHLMLEGDASRFAVGNLTRDSFEAVGKRITSGRSRLIGATSQVSPKCSDSECFKYCRGGDRIGGYIHTGKAIDPFCPNTSSD